MIKAKVVSLTIEEAIGGVTKLDLETYLEDPVVPELFCGADFWDGLDIIIMTKGDYEDEMSKKESLRKRLNEKEGEICKLIVNNDVEQGRLREEIKKLREENKGIEKASDTLRNSLLDEREKTEQLEETIKRLKERLAQEAAEVYLCPDGTIVFKKKKVSELEKKVKKLEEENKALKDDKFSMKITGGLFYKED